MLAVLFTAELLVMLDGMSVSVALPEIGDDVGLEGAELQFVVTAYTVPLGSFLLLGGRAADRWGRRRILVGGLAAFAAGSLAAGLAGDAAVLLSGRVVSGVGAAFAIPAALGLVTAVTSAGPERNRVLGMMAATQAFGVVAGALLGGVVTYALGWPWVFLVVVPVAALAAVLGAALLPESSGDDRAERLDWVGATAVALGLALLILALVRLQREGLGGATTPALAGSAVLLALFVLRQRAADAPLLPLRLFRSARVTGANVTVVANAGAFTGTVVLSTLLMQRELGMSALETGLAFAPLSLSALGGCLLAPRLMELVGSRATVAASLLTTASGLAWIAAAPADGYAGTLLPAYIVTGFTFAAAAVPLTAEAIEGARGGERAVAAGLFQTFTHVGGAVVLALLVVCSAAWGLTAGFAAAAGGLVAAAGLALVLLRAPHLHLEPDVAAGPGSGRREGRPQGRAEGPRARAAADRVRAAEGGQGERGRGGRGAAARAEAPP
jgi:MFS family permease